jgi:hypothetical protein
MRGPAPVADREFLKKNRARELAELALSTDLLEVDQSLAAETSASEVLASHGRGKNVALLRRFHCCLKQLYSRSPYVHWSTIRWTDCWRIVILMRRRCFFGAVSASSVEPV